MEISKLYSLYPIRGAQYIWTHSWAKRAILTPLATEFGIVALSFLFLYVFTSNAQLSIVLHLIPFSLSKFFQTLLGLFIITLEVGLIGAVVFIFYFQNISQSLYDQVLITEGIQPSQLAITQSSESEELKQIKKEKLEQVQRIKTVKEVYEKLQNIDHYLAKFPKLLNWKRDAVQWAFMAVTSPLALIPFFGWAAFIIINGFVSAWKLQGRYFQLAHIDDGIEQGLHIARNPFIYLKLGVPHLVLKFIPLIGPIMEIPCVIGAALATSDVIKKSPQPAIKPAEKVKENNKF